MKPSEFLTEAAAPKVGRKYQHIEDLVLSDGSHGGLHAVERLKHMGEEGGSIELKWDGMPVLYWGRDEQGNFSMIPKNAWQYLKSGKTQTSSGAPTVMRSPDDIKKFVLGTGGGDTKARQQFANQFANLWPYFEKISPKKGFLEGGILFYPGIKPDGSSAMPVLNSETNTYDFTPNITTFHIPVDSELGKKIAKSKVMVAATGYYPSMGSDDEQRFPDAEKLSVPGVIVQGTTYVQEPVPLDSKGLDSMEAFIKTNAKLIDNYLAPKPGLSNPGAELYTYLNKHLRTEGLLADFPDWARANLSPKKAETLLSDPKGLKATLGAVEGLGKQKNVLINQLSQGMHGGIKQTKPEGYAQAHPGKQFNYDLPGQFIKTIDQTNWAPKESVVNEAKKGSSAVVGWGRGMGHTGHDALVNAVIHQAETTGATPYFVVSRSFGKDDPIPPETKIKMYQKKFPKYAKMFSLPPEGMTTLNQVLADLVTKGVTDVTLVVGETEKDAFGYLTRPDKSGVPPYKNFGLNSLTVMSRQDTKAPGSDKSKPDYHEGPRATPMREVLLDPEKFKASNIEYANMPNEEMQFTVWRKAMSPALDDSEVLDMMNTAKQNLIQFHTKKPRRKASDIKEHFAKMRPLLKEATVEQKYKMLKLMKEAYLNMNEDSEDEIHDYDKLDNILLKLCELVVTGQKTDPGKYGMVAACVLDNKNRMAMGVNLPAEDGTRRHAERVAIDKYQDKYGEIPEGSIIVTTCSPCSEHMSERHGEDCTQLINDSGIKKVYAGYNDPTQPEDERTFNCMETSNVKIRQLCKQFAEQFMDMEKEEQQHISEKMRMGATIEPIEEYSVRNTKKFIQRAHDIEQGQSYGSQPYSSHPKAVANIGKKFFGTQFTPEAVKVALLHDVLEDTPYTPQQLAQKGFSKEVIKAVQLLTKDKNLSSADNIKNIINSGNKLAMMVKYSDNYMNYTGDKSHWESERAKHSNKKYLASLNMLGDVLGIKKHLGDEESVVKDTNIEESDITESMDYLEEK